jgi:hypothetical protein
LSTAACSDADCIAASFERWYLNTIGNLSDGDPFRVQFRVKFAKLSNGQVGFFNNLGFNC